MSSFYPDSLHQRFTDRVSELATLAQVTEDLERGLPRHIALFGLRRIGKTLLCQEQVRQLASDERVCPVYIDLEDICTSPELFAQRYVGLCCFWAFERGQGSVGSYLSTERLLQTRAAGSSVAVQTASAIISELGRQKVDFGYLLTLAFEFPERLAEEIGRPLMCFLDEFTELATLGNYPGVGEPLKHFRAAVQRQSRVAYVIAGSAISAMERLIRDHESPLFLQFRSLELRPLTAEDTRTLAEKVANSPLLPAAHSAIFNYTFGHPFYVTALAERLPEVAPALETATPDQVGQAFLLEALSARGQIYGYCRYLYDISLQKARGYGVLKATLQILAEEENLTLTEVARRLHRRPAAAQGYLRWLLEVDLLVEQEKRYAYRDPVLRFWVAQNTRGVEIDGFPRREELAQLLADLGERFQRTATQLGRAKESEIRELLRALAGRTLDGAPFGQAEEVVVPRFTEVAPYRSPDGQVEIDALAGAEDGGRWAVEVKWRLKRVGWQELEALVTRSAGFGARAWCISQAGFTPDAAALARDRGVLISTEQDLAELQRRLYAEAA
jgi:AAA+ ATPase superfamily predicted ATPase